MSHSVLVIDDLSFYRRRLRNLLRELGYRVHEASDADAGVEMARRLNPDFILLDEVMPGGDAQRTLVELRTVGESLGAFRVIVLSPRSDGASARALLDGGADAVLPKTAGRDEIQSALVSASRASAA